MATILYVDDEPAIGLIFEDTLIRAGHRAIGARSVVDALQVLTRDQVDLIISDYRMPGLTGLEFLALLQREGYDIPVIMVTGYASVDHAVSAIKAGAVDYITKPIRTQQLELAVEQALAHERLRRENMLLRRSTMEHHHARAIIGQSAAVQHVLRTIATAAPTRATVLVQGESGTGKTLFARAIHDQSDRAEGAFVQVSCTGIPATALVSAIFGHERGAFTGANRRTEGAIEQARGGTLVLHGIADLPAEVQARLLRVIQEGAFERLGGTHTLTADVRLIVTSHRSLEDAVARGAFREDLYYRLTVIPVDVPPLRERAEDIPQLAFAFATRSATETGKDIVAFAPDALQILQTYPWPGNVRELEQAVERAVILSQDRVLHAHLFEPQRIGSLRSMVQQALQRATPTTLAALQVVAPQPADGVVLTSLKVDDAERALIRRALEVTGGNRTRTAELLGISVRTLRNKLNGPQPALEPIEG